MEDDYAEEVGKRARALRIWSGLSLAEAAEQAGISTEVVRAIESGKSPVIAGLPGLASGLGRSLEFLLLGEERSAEVGALVPEMAQATYGRFMMLRPADRGLLEEIWAILKEDGGARQALLVQLDLLRRAWRIEEIVVKEGRLW